MIMTELERRQERKKFTDWRARARKAILPIISKIFAADDYNNADARKLGRVIEALHNPYYDILDKSGNHLHDETIIAMRILLQIDIEDLVKKYK